ncbi:hypothetical protein BC643_3116 [Mangrovibacterium diazotrophicum]|uniref:Uncharacterized protein n=1 Tax=Mangrovibacterium diazotrophicum TaxID=1261403 RepID=A0A419WBC2_9BACT|nr:hypothetical protein BC643_3116 [Mangrovibacterium diazotrophicum]
MIQDPVVHMKLMLQLLRIKNFTDEKINLLTYIDPYGIM